MMKDPFDFKRGLKRIWAKTAGVNKPSLEDRDEIAVKSLYPKSDPLSEVLAHLALRNAGLRPAPLIPRITPLPVAELCQLVLLWSIAGEKEAAGALAQSIPLDFPWMWCAENEYNEEEALASTLLLKNALGAPEDSFALGDPYFQALAENLSHLPTIASPNYMLDTTRIEAGNLKCSLTFWGDRTSLGAMVSESVEIRSFGPQGFPLSDPAGFGIRSIAQHGNRWASPAACPEVWFDTKTEVSQKGVLFELSFFGLKPTHPFAFSFYIRADSAQIGSEKLKPGTLQRYQGPVKPLFFGDDLKIESLMPGKLEVIPLAGSGNFWDSDYLAAFEIHPVNAKMAFFVSSLREF